MAAINLYVGTYTEPHPRTGEPRTGKGIVSYRMDPETGALTHLRTTPAVNASWLTLDPTAGRLFAVVEMKAGAVASYAVDRETGDLLFRSEQPTAGGDPIHLALDPTGRWLIVPHHEDGRVTVLPVDGDGRIGAATQVVQHVGSGPHPTRQAGPHAHFATFDAPGRHVLVCDKGTDKVMVYRLDETAGTLAPNDPPFGTLHPGATARHLAFHPNGRWAYVNGEVAMTLTAFAYDAERGIFEEIHRVSTVPEGESGDRFLSAQVLVDRTGRFCYVSNRGHDSIAIFAIDGASGRLTPLGHEPTRGKTPRNIALDPSGTFLYAANQDSDTLVCFRVDRETGRLAATGGVTSVGTPVCVAFQST